MTGGLLRGVAVDTDPHTGRRSLGDEGRDKVIRSQASGSQRLPVNHKKPEKAMEEVLTHGSQKGPTLPTPRSQMPILRNAETIHFCCVSHLVCGTLLQQPRKLETPFLVPPPFYPLLWPLGRFF